MSFAQSYEEIKDDQKFMDSLVNIETLRKGDIFTRHENGPLWVRSDYNRHTGKYIIYKYDDLNHFSEVKKGYKVIPQ